MEAKKKGQNIYGLSYDAITNAIKTVVNNQNVRKIVKFVKPDSLDIVTRPAAGGAFNRAVASRPDKEESFMNKEELWKLIEQKRPDLITGRTLAGMADDEVKALFAEAMTPPQTNNNPKPDAGQGDSQRSIQEINEKIIAEKKKILEKIELSRCSMDLDNALKAADFPDEIATHLKAKFKNRIFEQSELDTAIQEQKVIISKMQERFEKESKPDYWVRPDIRVGMGSFEKMCIAMDKLFGLKQDELKGLRSEMCIGGRPKFEDTNIRSVQDIESYDSVPSFEGLRQAYIMFTGDRDMQGRFVRRNLPPELRARADITSQTFTYVLGNTMHRRIVQTYRQADWGENLLISTKKNTKDFRTQEAILMGYFPDIATVDPETSDYQEIATVNDEEASYSVITKGHILTITEKTIINDDITTVQKLVERFGRAFRRTHAQYIWNFWINNSNCSDATAWHTSGHGNLGATALDFSTFATGWNALAKMTEKDSGSRLGMLDDPNVNIILVYPPDVHAVAGTIIRADEYWGTDQQETTKRINPYKGRVVGRQNSLLTDTNDWGMFIPGNYIDHLEIGYLNGREEPEFFVADSPQSEQVFVADKIRWKGRMRFGGTPVD